MAERINHEIASNYIIGGNTSGSKTGNYRDTKINRMMMGADPSKMVGPYGIHMLESDVVRSNMHLQNSEI